MSFDWFPWFPHHFRRDTRHLTLEEDGAYRRLIDEYMITRQALPADAAALARVIGIPKAEYDRIAPRVIRFFRLRNNRLWHKRCEAEIRAQNARHNRNSEKAKKAAFARYSKINGLHARGMLEPTTLHNKDLNLPSSVQAAARARDGPNSAPAHQQVAWPQERQERIVAEGEQTTKPHQATRAEIEASFQKKRERQAAKAAAAKANGK